MCRHSTQSFHLPRIPLFSTVGEPQVQIPWCISNPCCETTSSVLLWGTMSSSPLWLD